jgi:tagatose-6-phosphate ketose/aldose isomerase
MHFSAMSAEQLAKSGARWTAHEIGQQPQVWRKVEKLLGGRQSAAARFLTPLLQMPELRIVLTGAGSSSFIGECLAPAMSGKMRRSVQAVSTTDLVAGPANWLLADVPTLLVSFARSGNSPESVAALELAQQGLKECHHLVITCNAQGALREIANRMANAHVVLLPEETNDKSLAMTSSFSSMLLAAALCFELLSTDELGAAADAAQYVLDHALPLVQDLVRSQYERVVYLGANELKGLAREGALKLLELTDGRVVSMADTPLGFRHGPKTIVNQQALVVVFLSGDPYSRQYDLDLVHELRNDGVAGRVLALAADEGPGDSHPDTFVVPAMAGAGSLRLCFPYLVFAQLLALLRSLALGIGPDNPNPAGMVNRVVKGVSIYPLEPAG